MAFFNSFTDSLKQKWLQFFQANREWISLHMAVESVYTPDGGKRPPSYLILGVVNALDPKLAQLMFPFAKLNPDADTLIEVLDLNFDPDIALGNRFIPPVEIEDHQSAVIGNDSLEDETLSHNPVVDELRDTHKHSTHEVITNGLGDISFGDGHSSADEFTQISGLETVDEFEQIAFDSTAVLDDETLDELNTTDTNAFSDVLSDVWGDETSLQKTEENNDFLGEELPSGVFDESEIARLFPNS